MRVRAERPSAQSLSIILARGRGFAIAAVIQEH
jgi:hypothetical protein